MITQTKREVLGAVKQIILAALFLLGGIEMIFPFVGAITTYRFEPIFARVFDVNKLTSDQRELYRQFNAAMQAPLHTVLYFGVATIVLGILFLLADRKQIFDA